MWWLYYVVGAVLIAVASIIFVLYRGYNRIKPKPLAGIPCPPLSHPVLGHHDMILHPLKHELRAQVCESSKAPIHQLVMMKFMSIFVNNSVLALQVLNELPNKGKIYHSFRYDADVPDIFTADGEEHRVRRHGLERCLRLLQLSDVNISISQLIEVLDKHTTSGDVLNAKEMFGRFALQVLCSEGFGVDVDVIDPISHGDEVLKALATMTDAQVSTGVYVLPDVRKVPVDQLQAAKLVWKDFLHKILSSIKASYSHDDQISAHTSTNLSESIAAMMKKITNDYQEKEAISDIHQLLKHGIDNITGSLSWLCYALHKHPKVRARLEVDVHHNGDANYPYVDAVIKETLRRYPVAGNMTVRSVDRANYSIIDDIVIPEGTPVHFHMWSIHNSAREWDKPRDFLPGRWLDDHDDDVVSQEDVHIKASRPRCPFALSREDDIYSSGGFEEDSLAYFPFSSGSRMCQGKDFAISIFRKVLINLFAHYHLDPVDSMAMEEDLGMSVHSIIIPRLARSTMVKVTKVTMPGKMVETVMENDKGWADDDKTEDEQ